jgi:hypothetical protein
VGSTIGKLLKKETGWVIRYPYREMVHRGTKGVMGSAVYIMTSKEINLNQTSSDLLIQSDEGASVRFEIEDNLAKIVPKRKKKGQK